MWAAIRASWLEGEITEQKVLSAQKNWQRKGCQPGTASLGTSPVNHKKTSLKSAAGIFEVQPRYLESRHPQIPLISAKQGTVTATSHLRRCKTVWKKKITLKEQKTALSIKINSIYWLLYVLLPLMALWYKKDLMFVQNRASLFLRTSQLNPTWTFCEVLGFPQRAESVMWIILEVGLCLLSYWLGLSSSLLQMVGPPLGSVCSPLPGWFGSFWNLFNSLHIDIIYIHMSNLS